MKNDRISALQVMVHGKALQACLNGALVSVKNKVSGRWEPFSSNWQFYAFGEDFSYRTKVSPEAPAIESPALGNTAFDPELPSIYRDHEFTFEQVKSHGAVIQYFLRGGTTQWASEIEGPYYDMTNGCMFAWAHNFFYRVAQTVTMAPAQSPNYHPEAQAPCPQVPCGCDICSDERVQEVAAYAKQKMETLAPPPFVQTVNPPLGIEPEYIWVERRIDSLSAAIRRQITDPVVSPNWKLVAEWSTEILERQEQLEGINRIRVWEQTHFCFRP